MFIEVSMNTASYLFSDIKLQKYTVYFLQLNWKPQNTGCCSKRLNLLMKTEVDADANNNNSRLNVF